ncbi:CFA58 protein, partial [Rhinopomastus cyanomelas]|nr:CFA58 protein [Rhinopomastus cyanomelas]
YLEESAFEALEKDFQDATTLLKGDKTLEKFRIEYEKLHAIVKKYRENEKRLLEKYREVNAELVVASCKVSTLSKLSEDDQETISSMKKELEKAWKMVDVAYEKEQKAKRMIHELENEIENLNKSVKQESGLSPGQEFNLQDLLKHKEELTQERNELLSELVKLRQSLTQATEQQEEAERAKTEADKSIMQLQQEIQLHQNVASQEAQKKEKVEKDLKNLLVEMNSKQAEIKNLQQHIQKSKEEQQKMEQLLKEQKILNEETGKELEQFQMRNNKLMQESEQHSVMFEKVMKDMQQKTADLKARDEEVNRMHLEISKLKKLRDVLHQKVRVANEQKVDAEHERNAVRNQISSLERELEATRKQEEVDKKAIDELVREKNMLNRNLVKATSATQQQIDLVRLHEESKKILEQEITSYKNEAQKQRKIIYQLEKERDNLITEANDLKQKLQQHMKDLELRQIQICDYEKKMKESAIKARQQEIQCDTVRAEKNHLNKSLIEAKDEITEMKQKLKTATHQMDELKEEIADKKAALAKAHVEHQKLEEENALMNAEMVTVRNQALETKRLIENHQKKEQKLLKIIAEADAERLKQMKEFDQAVKEKGILGSELVRRNEEVALLYEKIKILQSILNRGDKQYQQRIEDIRLLKMELKKLRREKGILGKSATNVEELRQKLHYTQKELLKEQTRCKTLEEELNNPLNVHRWRKLEASDPGTYELIQKIHKLQKQLISKTDEVIEKELLLQQEEKLYVELKLVLARQPGPEAAEQMQLYRHVLREKTKQLKALSSELSTYESQNYEYKHKIERLSNELLNVKKKFVAQKRKEQWAK